MNLARRTLKIRPMSTHAQALPQRGKPVYHLPLEPLLLYADRGLIVINKPSGLISHLIGHMKEDAERNPTVQLFTTLLEDLRDELKLQTLPQSMHRLDKPTTGILAFACTKSNARDFNRQFALRQVEKTYLALVLGTASSFPKKSGTIDTMLECTQGRVRIQGAEDVYVRELPQDHPQGENWIKAAKTDYKVLASSSKLPLTLLQLQLHTGLKHQLRVHLAQHLRTPILGDRIYCDPDFDLLRRVNKAAPTAARDLFLHASQFSLYRYRPARTRLTIGAPLPATFVDLCAKAEIPLSVDAEHGGVWVDGVKVRGADILPPENAEREQGSEGELEQLGGRWFGKSLGPEYEMGTA